jgi:hypothetical protein
MARQGTHPPGLDASRPGPGPGIPKQLQASFRLWLAAVAAGLFETALVVIDATDGSVGSASQVAAGVAVRLLVFTGAVYLAARLRQGRNWARVALAAADLGSVLFAASRVVHLGAVIAALMLMFHPAANAYIRATTRTPAHPGEGDGDRRTA